jgi:dTDP-4-dehydrorhamnose 3,5-epimerase
MSIICKEDDEIVDLIHLHPHVFYDFRGEYVSTYNSVEYEFLGVHFLEDDISVSRKNVLRGLHGDSKTKKLIQCLHGSILLAVADLREESPSYLKSRLFLLSDKNRHQVFIPEGCVNGHYVLSDSCIFSYKQTEIYSGAKNQISIRYNDPWLKIPWKVSEPILSTRDSNAKFLRDMSEECRKL